MTCEIFKDTFETHKRSLISAFSICMTVPLNYKRFIFPSFKFDGFKDPIDVPGGEIKWKFSHDVQEKDAFLEANLRKAPKLTTKVLHPGNCKQNVPTALANIS